MFSISIVHQRSPPCGVHMVNTDIKRRNNYAFGLLIGVQGDSLCGVKIVDDFFAAGVRFVEGVMRFLWLTACWLKQ